MIDLTRPESVPADEIPKVLADLEQVRAILWHRLTQPTPNGAGPTKADRDLRLTPDEVAERLGVTKRWVYRRSKELGGTRLSHRRLRFSEAGLRRYLARRAPG